MKNIRVKRYHGLGLFHVNNDLHILGNRIIHYLLEINPVL